MARVTQLFIVNRNRYTACIELQIEPIVKQWDGNGSLLDFVRDMNFNRRQLDISQRAMVAARMKPLYEQEAKTRMLATQNNNAAKAATAHGSEQVKGETTDIVGAMMGVSGASVKRAARVTS